MTEINRAQTLKVGLFLVVGLAMTMLSIFMIGGNKSLLSGKVRFAAEFEQVQGLSEGSVISLAGLPVGNIESFSFKDQSNKIKVLFYIEKDYASRITEGSQVEIRTQGALGDKYIYIFAGQSNAAVLPELSTLPTARASDLLGIISERGKETEKVFDIIHELHKLTLALNQNNQFSLLIKNMGDTSENLKNSSLDLKQFSRGLATIQTAHLESSLQKMDKILTKIDRGQGSLGALVNDSTLHEQLKVLLGGNENKKHIKSLLRTSIERSEEKP
jgi:phospholipid/cholesterol/gamma-HCH transport system substrate-binding protein